MRLISWNVNGIRAVAKKGFLDTVKALDPDVLCIQETKASVDQLDDSLLNIPGYKSYFSSAERKGYSGTCVYTKREPVSVSYGLGTDEFDHEGRTIELDLKQMDEGRMVLVCGDVNTAHKEIDLSNPKANATKNLIYPELSEGAAILFCLDYLFKIAVSGCIKLIVSVIYVMKRDRRIIKRKMLHDISDITCLGLRSFKKLLSCRCVEKKISHNKRRSVRSTYLLKTHFFTAAYTVSDSDKVFPCLCYQIDLRNG